MASFQKQDVEGIRVLRLSGSLTQHDVEELEPSFEAALPDGTRAVIDLADVELITTPGITLIISTTKRLHDTRGRVVFTAARPGVLDVLRRCRLDEVLELAPDRDQALQLAKT
jgi:anti-sigma B factor antagonist/stage II sporulation protein AA (anti-sigma F factor antagonist)